MLKKTTTRQHLKNGHSFPCILFFFIHLQPNNICTAWQQPRALFLIPLSLVEEGWGGHSFYILALRLLDCMGFAMEAKTEWKRGGGANTPATALGLGISAPPPTHPKFSSFVLDWEGALKCFILCDQTTGDLKSHHLQAWATLTAMSVPPRPPFLSAELWVILYRLGNLGEDLI